MRRKGILVGLLLGTAGLAACGGGGGDAQGGTSVGTDQPIANSPNQSYHGISNSANAQSNVTVAGVTKQQNGQLGIALEAGNINHANANVSAVNLSGLSFTLNQPNGFEYVGFIDGSLSGGVGFSGVVGIQTHADDMPASGQATFSGPASVAHSQNGQTHQSSGQAQITADFSAGQVDAVINVSNSTLPFDQVVIADMAIGAGGLANGFGFGSLTFMNNGAVVQVTGAGTFADTSGAFYGYDANGSGPAEVGGAFYAEGNDGSVTGQYVGN